jgi:response regulator RpfG family c-di-GMP phosphodiesterase
MCNSGNRFADHTAPMTPVTSVLIVDDEPAVRDLMSRWVASLGLRSTTVSNADEALASLRINHYDLAVIDVMMPGQDGLWLAGEMQREHPNTAVIVATAYTELLGAQAEHTPIADFLIKPFQRERFALAVDRGRQWRKLALEEVHWHALLSIELRDRTAEVVHALDQQVAAGLREGEALASLFAGRLPEVAAHGERVARYSQSVARQLDLGNALLVELEIAARFHDVGKLAMPEALMSKPSPLTRGENAIMRQHAVLGAEILESTRELAGAAPAVRSSHEWFEGGGYPERASGNAIPRLSRLIAVADAYDAMTQDRSYRIRLDSSDAIAEILRCSPSQFDPQIVAAFITVLGRH